MIFGEHLYSCKEHLLRVVLILKSKSILCFRNNIPLCGGYSCEMDTSL